MGMVGRTGVFSRGKEGQLELRVGRDNRVLLIAILVSIKAHKPTTNRQTTQMGTNNSHADRQTLTACIPPSGPWRRCQFQAPRSHPSLEDYPIRIDKRVRDRI